MSETTTCRAKLAPWCIGNGLDIGAGGDPITNTAICVDREETHGGRAHVGNAPTHLVWDAFTILPFVGGVLDYIFSSHCLEDAVETQWVLGEWMRVLKVGGYLVLFLPDQQAYLRHCSIHGGYPNEAHKHADFSMDFVKQRLPANANVVYEEFPFLGNPYSFALVLQKVR